MKSLLFFDDWMLRVCEGFDREQGKPVCLKEIVLKSHPELYSIRGGGKIRYDKRREKFVTEVDCIQEVDRERFIIQLETDDPTDWPEVQWSAGDRPMWTRNEKAVIDQYGNPLCCFNVLELTDTPLAEKGYFMNLYRYKGRDGTESAATAFSQDGLRFEVDEKRCWIPYFSDTGNPTLYDSHTEQYMIYCRPEFVDRRVAMVTTTDLKTFSKPAVILQPDAEDPVCREFYGLDPVRYEDLYVGIVSVYDTEPTEGGRKKMIGTTESHLVYSYNGRNWYRAFRSPFISRTSAGTSFGGSVYASVPEPLVDDRMLFSVMGSAVDHGVDEEDCPEEWKKTWKTYQYDMRLDSFVYLRTRARHGIIQTKSVVLNGGELTVNARTTVSGYVKAAILDEDTLKPIPNYTLEDAIPVTGDELFGKVRWRNRENLDELKDRPVIIEVRVREGELYALRFSYRTAIAET